jgi:hypothetical protein
MHVRLERPGELEAELVDERGIAARLLEHRVDQQRLARRGVGEEIRIRRGLRIEELPENHVNNFTPVSALAGGLLIGAPSLWLVFISSPR